MKNDFLSSLCEDPGIFFHKVVDGPNNIKLDRQKTRPTDR